MDVYCHVKFCRNVHNDISKRCENISNNFVPFHFHFFLSFQMVSLLSMSIQFVAIAERNEIMLNKEDPVSTNLFSFIFSMGILVSFFKLTSDLLVIYGAKNVSAP